MNIYIISQVVCVIDKIIDYIVVYNPHNDHDLPGSFSKDLLTEGYICDCPSI